MRVATKGGIKALRGRGDTKSIELSDEECGWSFLPRKFPTRNFLGGEKVAGSKQPIDLLLAKGKKHLTKKEIEKRKSQEVKAANDKVEAPSYLPENLKKEFNRIAEELINIKIMSNLDVEALARFIIAEYQYQKVVKKAIKMSPENDKYFDMLLMQEKLFKMARQAAGDLGLTISSRCKLVVPTKEEEKPKNKFQKFM